jgi:hypothetical protein
LEDQEDKGIGGIVIAAMVAVCLLGGRWEVVGMRAELGLNYFTISI